MDVAVDEGSTFARSGIERLAAVEREAALAVGAGAAERIVGAFEVAVVEIHMVGTHEGTEVETRDEAAVADGVAVATADDELGLHDGRVALWAVEAWIARIDEIDVAVVAESDVFGMDVIAREVEHGEVAVRTLCLTTVAGNDDIFGIVAQADEAQAVHLDLEAKG